MGIVSLVGAAGGAGTTRLAVETAGHITARGDTVVVVDVDFATQGLADYVPGQFTTELTTALRDQVSLAELPIALDVAHTPQPHALPSFAGLSRVATAMQQAAAEYLGDQLTALDDEFDHVLLDTPTPVTNPAIAAVTTADTVGVVFPRSPRGIESLHRTEGFLHDIDVAADYTISTPTPQEATIEDPADIVIPQLADTPPRDVPTTLGTGTGSDAVESLAGVITG